MRDLMDMNSGLAMLQHKRNKRIKIRREILYLSSFVVGVPEKTEFSWGGFYHRSFQTTAITDITYQ